MIMFSPGYMLILGIGMAISLFASVRVKSTFKKYGQLGTQSGMTGAQVAQRILQDNDIYDVTVERVAGKLSDHYDPKKKVLRLSEEVYAGQSMAAFGVAAHEVGHALQDAKGYAPLHFRSAMVPMANIGSRISFYVIVAAGLLGGMGSAIGAPIGLLGLGLFGAVLAFTLVTLPVEFDASRRALVSLSAGGYATPDEVAGARKVLNAAALTYVAAFLTTLMTFLYYAYRLGLFGRR